MRLIYFIIISLCLSCAAMAQSAKHRLDYYVRADSTSRHSAAIKLIESDEIAIKDPSGKKYTLHADSIAWFQSEGRRYYTLKDFEVKPGNANSRIKYGFAELLDSGQVSLLRYEYSKAKLMVIGGLPGVGSSTATLYLLRSALLPKLVSIPDVSFFSDEQQSLLALQPYLVARPDILTPLLNRQFTIDDLPGIVRALNTNKQYVKPPSPNDLD